MDLKEFVGETIRQIIDGVAEAKDHGSKSGAEVNPVALLIPKDGATFRKSKDGWQYAQTVSFDVAVTTIEESHTKGGAKLAVAVFSVGGTKQSDSTNSTVSRVKFTVPVFLP